MTEQQREEYVKALDAISAGYTQRPSEGYIVVENPDFQEDNGSNPNLVIDCDVLKTFLLEAV